MKMIFGCYLYFRLSEVVFPIKTDWYHDLRVHTTAAISVVVLIGITFNVLLLVIAIAIGGDYIELSYEITYLWSLNWFLASASRSLDFVPYTQVISRKGNFT